MARATDLILAFSNEFPELRLRELAEATGLPKASTHRIAESLVVAGLLRRTVDGAYALGPQLIELGRLAVSSSPTLRAVRDVADSFALEPRQTLLVADVDWSAQRLVIVARRDAGAAVTGVSPVGRTSPLSNGGFSKVALATLTREQLDNIMPTIRLVRRTPNSIVDAAAMRAELTRVRTRGYGYDVSEYVDGVASVSVPVPDQGRALGVLSVVGPEQQMPAERIEALGRQLVVAVSALTPGRAAPASGGAQPEDAAQTAG
ncbi:IclR family transcriptional regulator [Tsukamurella sp. 8F]|uniref:IclR family transcriptional regulator n=1 Tax=Tsukamurella sp. 8F TaxID=3031961 RepID=UPI0023B9C0F7|nr:IclR family transcriptional regulator [Tsukamurella sp. 8F]MDF0589180.1 IclR family transcriptional regulator [Tsukamurella sp. 8F]